MTNAPANPPLMQSQIYDDSNRVNKWIKKSQEDNVQIPVIWLDEVQYRHEIYIKMKWNETTNIMTAILHLLIKNYNN